MKLIDADALRDYWHISELCESCHWNNIDCSKPPYYPLLDICKAIDEIPVVDAIPVEWMKEHRGNHGSLMDVCIGVLLMEWQGEWGDVL